jgi:hypothetical protein
MKNSQRVNENSYATNGRQFGYVYHTVVYSENSEKTYHYFGKRERQNFSHTYLGSGVVLRAVLKKRGKDNAIVEPVAWANSREELEAIESAWIAKAREMYGYACLNRHDGGTGGKMPQESIDKAAKTRELKALDDPLGYAIKCEKISRAMKSRKLSPETIAAKNKKRAETRSKKTYVAWNRGIPMTDEAKAKASASLTGKPGPNKGKTFGPETSAKQSAARKGMKFTQQHRENMKATNGRSVPYLNLATGEKYRSLTQACEVLKLSYGTMKKRAANGTIEQFGLKRISND